MICERLQNQNKTNNEWDTVESKYTKTANDSLSYLSNSRIFGVNGSETNKEGKALTKAFLNIIKEKLNA